MPSFEVDLDTQGLQDEMDDLRDAIITLSNTVEELSDSNANLIDAIVGLVETLTVVSEETQGKGLYVTQTFPESSVWERHSWDPATATPQTVISQEKPTYVPLTVPPFGAGEPRGDEETWNKAAIKVAIDRKANVKFVYERPPGRFQPVWEATQEERIVRPNSIETIGTGLVEHTVVSCWDTLKLEPRNFRLDRIRGYVRLAD